MAANRAVPRSLPTRKSAEAEAMIAEQGLEAIVRLIENAIRDLYKAGVAFDEVEIERIVDPEIDDWITLKVTAWMRDLSEIGDASSANDRLFEHVRSRLVELAPEDVNKFQRLVFFGVDVE